MLFVAVISRLFLKENVGWARMTTILVGFTGVMLVVQPTLESESLFYVGTGLVPALGAAIVVICVRKIANEESKTVVVAYQAIFVGSVALIPAIIQWQWPTWSELALLVLVGVISSIGHWFGVTAYKWGEANIVSNVECRILTNDRLNGSRLSVVCRTAKFTRFDRCVRDFIQCNPTLYHQSEALTLTLTLTVIVQANC